MASATTANTKVMSEGPAALRAVREEIAKREVELEQYSDEYRAAEPEPVDPNNDWFVRLEKAAEEAEETSPRDTPRSLYAPGVTIETEVEDAEDPGRH